MSDFFRNAQDFTVNNGSFNSVGRDQINITNTSNPDDILNFVGTHAAGNAFYNSEQRFPPPNCHPGTRVKILAELEEWIADRSTSNRVCWLHGYAGVGKSAIMQNLSEKHANPQSVEQHPRLAASFFFSRNDSTRDKLDPFVATIIYQFLRSEPLRAVLGSSIIEAIRSDPKIFHTTFENQFQKLVLEPCSKVALEAWDNLPNVIVIDGLDECILIPSQERLVTMIRKAIPRCRLIFLIASRPEPRICRAFDHESFTSLMHRLSIGNSPESTRDITTYFHHQFAQLQDTHHALRGTDVSWPGEDVIWQLVKRACGQFIFAVTVMKYLESDDDLPTERLETILRIRVEDLPESPYPALDLLYHQILETCPNWEEVRRLLCLLVTPKPQSLWDWDNRPLLFPALPSSLPFPISVLRSTECVASILGFNAGKIKCLIFKLHAVITWVPNSTDWDMQIAHASFTEFLSDPLRSRNYHVEKLCESDYNDLLAQVFLRTISEGCSRSTSTPILQQPWRFMDTEYSLAAVSHLILALERPSDAVLVALDQFDPYYFASQLLHSRDPNDIGEFKQVGSLIAWAKNHTGAYHPDPGVIESPHFCTTDPNTTYHFFPIDRPPPTSWSTVTVTCEKAKTIDRLLVSLDDGGGRCYYEPYITDSLIEDIQKDTAKSLYYLGQEKVIVTLAFFRSFAELVIQANDLYTLKLLVAQRRQEFGLKTSSCTLLFNSEGEAAEEISDSYRPPDADLDHEDGSTGNNVVPYTLDTSSVGMLASFVNRAANALPFATGDFIANEGQPVHKKLDRDMYRGSVGEATEKANNSASSSSNEVDVSPTRANRAKRSVSIKDSNQHVDPDNTPLHRSSRTTRATARDQLVDQGSSEKKRRGRAPKHRKEPELETDGAGTSSTVENRRRKRRKTW
ncbi:hypothetical protein VNI00_015867 [Paramarasmius palmivorus]|uniref:NACHT domain-containing protein n=1 Tax=Paramarasmius palmivorus TaxID=297713 RepID=A0AAW0BI56_9AGAR